jgi:hypothetical protein
MPRFETYLAPRTVSIPRASGFHSSRPRALGEFATCESHTLDFYDILLGVVGKRHQDREISDDMAPRSA